MGILLEEWMVLLMRKQRMERWRNLNHYRFNMPICLKAKRMAEGEEDQQLQY